MTISSERLEEMLAAGPPVDEFASFPRSKMMEVAAIREIITELQALRQAAGNIMPYLRWTISDESPGHHPTMPSAVAEFASLTNHPPLRPSPGQGADR